MEKIDGSGWRELRVLVEGEGIELDLVGMREEFGVDSLRWVSDAEVVKYMGMEFGEVSLEGEIARIREILGDRDALHWIISVSGRALGNVNLNSIVEKSEKYGCRAASVAILIGDKQFWGKGIARAVIERVVSWSFEEGGFEVLEARILAENLGSVKVFKACGFELVGEEAEDGRQWGVYLIRRR